jgi:hypothetical protein
MYSANFIQNCLIITLKYQVLIFLRYPYYDTKVFDGYECFILSIEQIGVENYMLVNDTQSRVDYFSNMFEVAVTRDLGNGSVIAFNDGKIDDTFWDRVTHYHDSSIIKNMMGWDLYPVKMDSTLEDTKENIIELAKEESHQNIYCDYVTLDDIFVSEEGKEIQKYISLSSTSVFMQEIFIREDRVIAKYTRLINGFLSDERIVVNGYTGENGNVVKYGREYTSDDLDGIIDMGKILDDLNMSELNPPHIEILDEMEFKYSIANGVYRKSNEKVYGIIRIMWYYSVYPEVINEYQMDDMYYLYDENGVGRIVERNELKELIGEDDFIQSFPYDSIIAWD